ncbi:MAG: peptidylprolyl isomerase [Gemmatimonadales bacterium]
MLEPTTLRRAVLWLALLAAPAASAAAQQFPDADADVVDRVLAVVGDSMILQTQVLEEVRRLQISDSLIPQDGDPEYAAFFDEILQSWVDRYLVLQAAAKDSLIQPDEAAIDRQVQDRLDQLALQFGGQPALQIALQRDGWTLGEYREFLRNDVRQLQIFQLFFQRHLAGARPVEVTEEELRRRFDELRPQLQQRPRLITFRQVVVAPTASDSAKAEARAEAEALVDSIVAGRDFAELATKYSDDIGTASVGGDLGWFRRGQMVREFEDVAFGVPAGRVSRVVETVFGFHIIKVERIRGRSEIQARHILKMPEITPADVERARDLAADIARRAQAGESMTTLYDEYSDPLAEDSMTVAFDQLGQLPPAYGSALTGTRGGEIIGPLEYQAGSGATGDIRLAVLKVIDVREAGAYTFEDLRTQLSNQIRQERQRERILEDLRAQTFIEIRM